MLKSQRNYRAEFEIYYFNDKLELIPQEKITIAYPFTCEFEVDSGTYQASNTGIFSFINLSEQDQGKLWVDVYNIGKKYIYMRFFAGYGNTMPLIFEGKVQECTSEKRGGSTEFITQMRVADGGMLYQYGFLNSTFSEGTTLASIVKVATQGVQDVNIGYITPEILPIKRNRTLIGQPINLLAREYGGYKVFVDHGEINILGDRDVIPGEVAVITDESGLLGSPRRANGYVFCDTIFEPQIRTAQAISLISETLPWLNQSYQVVRVKHRGVISPVISGNLTTSLTLTIFPEKANVLKKDTTTTFSGSTTKGVWRKPVQGTVSSPFGERKAPTKGASSFHKGIDIAANYGEKIIAPANGRVFFTGAAGGYGNCIQINHGVVNGVEVTTLYGHLSTSLVKNEQVVAQGEEIALVGSSGISTGPHLHFEVRENGRQVNPNKYIGNY